MTESQTSDTVRPEVAGESAPPYRYTAALAAQIETHWQDRWDREHIFEAPNPAGPMAEPEKVAARPKKYVLDMFPYPSGIGLHVGHPLGYIATDVFGRFKRMTGHNVLHALGYDAFGLPASRRSERRRYISWSAFPSSVSSVPESHGASIAPPALTRTGHTSAGTSASSTTVSRTRRSSSSGGMPGPGPTTQNSSPPQRATTSVARVAARIASATATITSSPTA